MTADARIDEPPGDRPAVVRMNDAQERQIVEFVEGIIRRARLWRHERNDVRLELLDHFDDGFAAGRSVEQLLADFGSARAAAVLIRAAKLRNRPLAWHVQRRALQVCGTVLCVTGSVFLFLVARLHLAPLGPPTDIIGELDSATFKIAKSDRGWPDYREGLMRVDRSPRKIAGRLEQIHQALVVGPADPHWDQAVLYLDAQRAALDLFVKGASRPRLGYLFRDTANDPWLKVGSFRSSAESYPRDKAGGLILMPHYQELGTVRNLLEEAALRALHDRNQSEFQRYWRAQSQLGTQVLVDNDFFMKSAGWASASTAMALLRRLVVEYSESVSDQQLQAYRQQLQAADWDWRGGSTVDQYRKNSEVFLNAVYSQDAAGNGRVSATGCQRLRDHFLALKSPDDDVVWTALLPEIKAAGLPSEKGAQHRYPLPSLNAANQELLALRWSVTLADRRDMRAKLDSMLDSLEAENPLNQSQAPAQSPYETERQQLATTPSLLRRYWPILTVLPRREHAYLREAYQPRQDMLRVATVTVIALEQFRRRTGNWPERLDQLVPGDLETIPQDVFSGRPLVYRLVNGVPLLYSVWEDRTDDGGTPLPTDPKTAGPHPGDFRFMPAR